MLSVLTSSIIEARQKTPREQQTFQIESLADQGVVGSDGCWAVRTHSNRRCRCCVDED